jgi:hypothetical protein
MELGFLRAGLAHVKFEVIPPDDEFTARDADGDFETRYSDDKDG